MSSPFLCFLLLLVKIITKTHGCIQEVYQKREIYKNMILFKRHPILYINMNYTSAPKEYKGSATLLNQAKLIATPSKALLFLSFQMIKKKTKRSNILSLVPSSLSPTLQLNINSFTDFGITQETPKPTKDIPPSHRDNFANVTKYDPHPHLPPYTRNTTLYEQPFSS